jgi:hypothetical protein
LFIGGSFGEEAARLFQDGIAGKKARTVPRVKQRRGQARRAGLGGTRVPGVSSPFPQLGLYLSPSAFRRTPAMIRLSLSVLATLALLPCALGAQATLVPSDRAPYRQRFDLQAEDA